MAYNIKKYANTHKQELFKHCYAIGILSTEILKLLTNNNVHNQLVLATFNAGCLHDIGKVIPEFQKWVTNTSADVEIIDGQHITDTKSFYESHARHNEVSLLIFHLLRNESDKSITRKTIELIEHVIYWHHAKPIRKDAFKNLHDIFTKIKDEEFDALLNDAYELIQQINSLSDTYKTIDFTNHTNDISYKLALPQFKDYNHNHDLNDYKTDIIDNAKNSFIRSIVITADRLISDLSVEELDSYINSNTLHQLAIDHLSQDDTLSKHIKSCLNAFHSKPSKRNDEQSRAAKKLAEIEGIAVLQGAAGCGKTKIALEWALNTNAKKIIWVCPRVSVCQNIYKDLTSKEYLHNLDIEICTGDFKYIKINGIERPNDNPFVGNIIVTTIDQLTNTILTHKHVTTLVDAVNSHVVFDEYHEYITMDAYNLLFPEFLECKKMLGEHTNTLLVSATPNPAFLEDVLDIHKDDCIKVKTFNDKSYTVTLQYYNADVDDEHNPLSCQVPDNTFVISNTVTRAQKSFLALDSEENALLLHGKFLPSDSKMLFNKTMECFGKHGDKSYEVLRSSHIIQASINITCNHMISEVSHAENILQRMGRLNRFAENENSELVIAIPTNFNKCNIGTGKFLYDMHIYDSASAWVEYLYTKKLDNITLDDIYSYYDDFYKHANFRQAVTKDILKSLKSSVGVIDKNVMDPVCVPASKTNTKRLSANSLRGATFYVQMAVCVVMHNMVVEYAKRYAYPENTFDNMLTLEYNKIVGYDDSNKNLLAYAHQKHHKFKNVKKSQKDWMMLNAARSPEYPLYVSYTVDDVAKGNDKNCDYAIYYVMHAKQAIGMMETKNLNF